METFHPTTNATGATIPDARVVITGASLVHRQLDKRQLAVLAADILDGQLRFVPTQRQLAALLNVGVRYIQIAGTLSPGKRAAIFRGRDHTGFAKLLPTQQPPLSPLPTFIPVRELTNISDEELVTMANLVGNAERWLAAGAAAGL
jgi:hypothetical protein